MKDQAECFLIKHAHNGTFKYQRIEESDLYNPTVDGIRRRAHVCDDQTCKQEVFIDANFQIPKSEQYTLVRLFDLYDQEQVDIFPDISGSALIDFQAKYNSFLAQSGLLEIPYLKTLFMNYKINKEGFYQYFVKRNGDYYLSCIDDVIPVKKKSKEPLWGLNKKYPWQLLLLKAWLKEKKTWERFEEAEPFEFLDAFGLRAYKTYNFKKQIDFLEHEKCSNMEREEKMKQFALHSKTALIYAKTINSQKVRKVGLPPNLAAFRIKKISQQHEQIIYKVESTVPVGWTGKNSLVVRNNLEKYLSSQILNLESSFLMNQKQVLKYFTKFYIAPEISLHLNDLKIQDTFHVNNNKEENWFTFTVPEQRSGLCAISFQLPKNSANYRGTYPEIYFFLSKKRTKAEIEKSHIKEDLRVSQKAVNVYIDSDCDKWQYYNISYHQGYYHHDTSFSRLDPGEYIMYAKVAPTVSYNIIFNSQVNLTPPEYAALTGQQMKVIFDSTFFQLSEIYGIETFLDKENASESISLSNTFDEIGFGSIVIKTMKGAKSKIAMRVFPQKLKEEGLDICDYYYEVNEGEGKNKKFVLVSEKGQPQIIVLKRIDNQKNSLNKPFPPPETIEFFKVTQETSKISSRK